MGPRKDGEGGPRCVELALQVSTRAPDELAARVAGWLQDWVAKRQAWIWHGNDIYYEEQFIGPPFGLVCTQTQLRFQLLRRPRATWWKDLLVFSLIKELSEAFAEIQPPFSIEVDA